MLDNGEEDDDREGREDDEYCPSPKVREKYQFDTTIDDADDDMPYEYRHVWEGHRSVREAYYVAMHEMKSKHHLSENQAEASVCIIANILFGRNKYGKWKRYDKEKPIDRNTLPAPTNTNRTEAYVESLILAAIADEIMTPGAESVVTYSNDGSAQSGVGSYVDQSFSINGKQRAFPTMSIFTESKESVKELK